MVDIRGEDAMEVHPRDTYDRKQSAWLKYIVMARVHVI